MPSMQKLWIICAASICALLAGCGVPTAGGNEVSNNVVSNSTSPTSNSTPSNTATSNAISEPNTTNSTMTPQEDSYITTLVRIVTYQTNMNGSNVSSSETQYTENTDGPIGTQTNPEIATMAESLITAGSDSYGYLKNVSQNDIPAIGTISFDYAVSSPKFTLSLSDPGEIYSKADAEPIMNWLLHVAEKYKSNLLSPGSVSAMGLSPSDVSNVTLDVTLRDVSVQLNAGAATVADNEGLSKTIQYSSLSDLAHQVISDAAPSDPLL